MEQHAGGHPEEGVLKETAIAIGSAAGKMAAFAKSMVPHSMAPQEKIAAPAVKRKAKLPPKKKARLPRKQKKILAAKKSA